jgi:hypothetical protein
MDADRTKNRSFVFEDEKFAPICVVALLHVPLLTHIYYGCHIVYLSSSPSSYADLHHQYTNTCNLAETHRPIIANGSINVYVHSDVQIFQMKCFYIYISHRLFLRALYLILMK